MAMNIKPLTPKLKARCTLQMATITFYVLGTDSVSVRFPQYYTVHKLLLTCSTKGLRYNGMWLSVSV